MKFWVSLLDAKDKNRNCWSYYQDHTNYYSYMGDWIGTISNNQDKCCSWYSNGYHPIYNGSMYKK